MTEQKIVQEETLMAHTQRLLHESGQSLPDVYAAMKARGSSVSFYWLRKFSSGRISDPSVNRIEELYKYLTGNSAVTHYD